jgi:hypothetical protein
MQLKCGLMLKITASRFESPARQIFQSREQKIFRFTFQMFRRHRNQRTRWRMSTQKWMISLLKNGKFKVGKVPADGLGSLHTTKNFFVFIKSARANRPGSILL